MPGRPTHRSWQTSERVHSAAECARDQDTPLRSGCPAFSAGKYTFSTMTLHIATAQVFADFMVDWKAWIMEPRQRRAFEDLVLPLNDRDLVTLARASRRFLTSYRPNYERGSLTKCQRDAYCGLEAALG